MAKTYSFDYTKAPEGTFKNPIVEENWLINEFANAALEVLPLYGWDIKADLTFLAKPDKAGQNVSRAYRISGSPFPERMANMFADVSIYCKLTNDYKLILAFPKDPLITYNTNDEIVEDIRQAMVRRGIIADGVMSTVLE